MSKLIISKGKVTTTMPLQEGHDYGTHSAIGRPRPRPAFGVQKAKGGSISGQPRKVRTGKAS